MYALIFTAAVVALNSVQVQTLLLEEPRPGALPDIRAGPPGTPGGKQSIDFSDRARYQRLEHLVQVALDIKQEQDQANQASNYIVHKLTKIDEATVQVVNGKVYEIKFHVGEQNCQTAGQHHKGCSVKHDGNFGQCFFEIFVQPTNTGLQVRRATCVKSTADRAGHHHS